MTDAHSRECWSHDRFSKLCQTCSKKPHWSYSCCSLWNWFVSMCCASFSYLMCSWGNLRTVLRANAFFILLCECRLLDIFLQRKNGKKISIRLWHWFSLFCLDHLRFITLAVHELNNSFVFHRDNTAVIAPSGSGQGFHCVELDGDGQWETSLTKQNRLARLILGRKIEAKKWKAALLLTLPGFARSLNNLGWKGCLQVTSSSPHSTKQGQIQG